MENALAASDLERQLRGLHAPTSASLETVGRAR